MKLDQRVSLVDNSSMRKTASYISLEVLKVLLEGLAIGVLIALYRHAAEYVILASKWCFYEQVPTHVLIGLGGLLIFGFVSNFLIRFDGNIQGSGIPQLEMNLLHKSKTIKWYSLPLMFINSLFSFFAGMPLGSEAPSTFMGGTLSLEANRIIHHEEEDDDVPLGMGCAFGVALMSPISGLFYSFEECLHSFKWEYIWKSLIMMVSSYSIAYLIYPSTPISLAVGSSFDYRYSWLFLVIIALNFVLAKLIIFGLKKIKTFFNAHYTNPIIKNRFLILYLLSIALMFVYPLLSGSGLSLVYHSLNENIAWYAILVYLIIRLSMFLLVGNSMASGGLMIPTLALGALVGEMVSKLADSAGLASSNNAILIIISMTSLFTMVNAVPLTSLTLSVSIGGYMNIAYSILPSFIVVGLSYLLMKLTKSETLNKESLALMRTSRKDRY